jgi:hypothetical protein
VSFGHLDENGQPCTRHSAVTADALLALAMIGARAPSFHHDIASKLQGLMMALDEISELVDIRADADMRRATDTAQQALTELNGLLTANRALTKPPVRARCNLADILTRAGDRVGVSLKGNRVDAQLDTPVPALTHALALAIDATAGTGRSRALAFESTTADGAVTVALALAATSTPTASESLAIASWLLARDGHELRCSPERIRIRLALATNDA